MPYQPKPLDVSPIQLSPELKALTERLAEDAHERWSKTRIAQGWTYGQSRDDDQKFHPSLIPYNQLSEDEKELDRVTAMGTLKLILALGYRILPPN
jgi:RyR domain